MTEPINQIYDRMQSKLANMFEKVIERVNEEVVEPFHAGDIEQAKEGLDFFKMSLPALLQNLTRGLKNLTTIQKDLDKILETHEAREKLRALANNVNNIDDDDDFISTEEVIKRMKKFVDENAQYYRDPSENNASENEDHESSNSEEKQTTHSNEDEDEATTNYPPW